MYLSCQSQYKICNLWNLPNEWHGCVTFVSFSRRLNCSFVYWSYCFWTFVGICLHHHHHQCTDCRDLISFKFAIQNIKWKSRVILLLCPQFIFWLNTVCCSTLVPIVVVNWIQLFIFPILRLQNVIFICPYICRLLDESSIKSFDILGDIL